MPAKRGRPKKENPLSEYLETRITTEEKQAFQLAADYTGLPLSAWIRVRLRSAAIRELQEANLPVRFLPKRKADE